MTVLVRLRCLAAAFLLLAVGGVWSPIPAQETRTVAGDEEVAGPSALLKAVTRLADDLQGRVRLLEAELDQADALMETGEQLLGRMLEAVQAAESALDQNGDVWQRVDALVALWEERRAAAQARAIDDARFLRIAQLWSDRVAVATALRKQISDERAKTRSMLRRIEADRAYILALIETEQADMVLTEMQSIRDTLVEMNRNIQMLATMAADSLDVDS